jgi:hypothetical protein
MTSGSLTDLDPAPSPERRWPFYLAWTVGSFAVGAVLFTHLPASVFPPSAPVAAPEAPAPIVTTAPAPFATAAPAPVRVLIPVAPAPLRGPAVPARTRR